MIKLESGWEVSLESLRQEKTYANVLEGIPRTKYNNDIIERWRSEAVKHERQRVVLIEPVRTPVSSHFNQPGIEAMFGPPECLPKIVCLGLFQSGPVRNEREDFSLLNILWFQDRFALPIDHGVVAQIQKLDWEKLAYNWTI